MEKISYHIQKERLERAAYIITTVGLGKVIKEERRKDQYGRYAWKQLTDTGVIIIMNETKDVMVTLWIASVDQINNFWGHNTPKWLYKVAVKNKKYAKKQDKGA